LFFWLNHLEYFNASADALLSAIVTTAANNSTTGTRIESQTKSKIRSKGAKKYPATDTKTGMNKKMESDLSKGPKKARLHRIKVNERTKKPKQNHSYRSANNFESSQLLLLLYLLTY
jgi:hypothetical protein